MRRVSPTSAAWLGLLICLLLTGLAWQLARRYDALERGARFRLESEEVVRAIAFRMQVYVTALQQARGLFAGPHEVTQDEFRAYVRNMDLDARYPGVLGVGFAARVSRAGAGEAYVVRLVEPLDEHNRRTLGYDMWTEPAR